MTRFALLRLCVLGLLFAGSLSSGLAQHRLVAITIDDLPFAGATDLAKGELEEIADATEALIAALDRFRVGADLFVTGRLVEVDGEQEGREKLLGRWTAAGHLLHNHGYSHVRLSQTPAGDYVEDVRRGQELIDRLAPKRDYTPFFRAPYNDLGDDSESRAALLGALDASNIRLAPFTVEHHDWMFDRAYTRARASGDVPLAARIGEEYLRHLDVAFEFAEELALETFGRDIPQVFLIHANRINADYLGAMLARLAARGYRFVHLEDALADEVYDSPDGFTGRWGFSWLHRWRMGMGRDSSLREAPEAPEWIADLASGD